MSNYPRDEFDDVPENSARHGVHRATMELPQRSLLPILIVGAAALCVGLLAFFVLPRLLDTSTTGTGAPPAAVESSATAPATAAEPATAAPATAAPATAAPTTAPAPTPSATPSAAPTAVVDRAVPVAIYNATGVPGLAARYAGTVTTSGWTVSASANWAGQPQRSSVIFYQDATQAANAQTLAELLGIPTVVETADMGLPLTVVLGPGA